MKAKKKPAASKRKTHSRAPRVEREKAPRNWTPFYVALQILLVAAALTAITRCSPLAPSANLHGDDQKFSALQTSASAAAAAATAGEETARKDLAKQLDNNSIPTIIDATEAEDVSRIERNARAASSITLSAEQMQGLIKGEKVELSLLKDLRRMNVAPDHIQKELDAVRKAIAGGGHKLVIQAYVDKRKRQPLAISTANGRIAVGDIDGLVKVWINPGKKSVTDLLNAADRIDVDIRSN